MKQIPLSKGLFALVDDEEFECVSRFKWYANKSSKDNTYYAKRKVGIVNGKQVFERLHRFILKVYDPKILIDHENGNGLDNRKKNLRIATSLQNNRNAKMSRRNTSGFKGVSWHEQSQKFRARINIEGKTHTIGSFDTAEEAGAAYVKLAEKLFGEFYRSPNEND